MQPVYLLGCVFNRKCKTICFLIPLGSATLNPCVNPAQSLPTNYTNIQNALLEIQIPCRTQPSKLRWCSSLQKLGRPTALLSLLVVCRQNQQIPESSRTPSDEPRSRSLVAPKQKQNVELSAPTCPTEKCNHTGCKWNQRTPPTLPPPGKHACKAGNNGCKEKQSERHAQKLQEWRSVCEERNGTDTPNHRN